MSNMVFDYEELVSPTVNVNAEIFVTWSTTNSSLDGFDTGINRSRNVMIFLELNCQYKLQLILGVANLVDNMTIQLKQLAELRKMEFRNWTRMDSNPFDAIANWPTLMKNLSFSWKILVRKVSCCFLFCLANRIFATFPLTSLS